MVFTIPDIFAKSKAGEGAREYFTLHGLPNRRNEDFHYTDLSRALQTSAISSDCAEIEIKVNAGNKSLVKVDELEVSIENGDDTLTRIAKGAATYFRQIEVASGFDGEIEIANIASANIAIELKIAAGTKLILKHDALSGSFSTFDMNIEVGAGAHLIHAIAHSQNQGIAIENFRIAVAKSATYQVFGIFTGSKTSRTDFKIALNGEIAKASINGVYILNQSHFDFSSNITHNAPNCESHTVMRGIANEGAHAIFQGKITVAKGAKKTIGNMEHRGIMIEDGARIFAKPNLEIYNDDVECSHANTIGAIDESALFYMQSRGISKPRARTMLTHAFLSSVFDDLENADDLNVNLENMLEGMLNV